MNAIIGLLVASAMLYAMHWSIERTSAARVYGWRANLHMIGSMSLTALACILVAAILK